MPPNWYQDPLFQDSQDLYDGYEVEEVEDLNLDGWSSDKFPINKMQSVSCSS